MPKVRVDYTTNVDKLIVAEVKLDDLVILKIVQGDNEKASDIRRMAENAETVATTFAQALSKQPPD